MNTYVTELANQRAARQNMETRTQEQKEELKGQQEALKTAQGENAQVLQRMQELTVERNKLAEEAKGLQQRVENVGNADENAKLSRLLKEKLPEVGFHGYVKDLGMLKDARLMKVAACSIGGSVNNLVIDHTDDSKKIIDWCKANQQLLTQRGITRLQSISCLCLDSLSVSTPAPVQGLTPLADIYQATEPRFAAIFQSICNNTYLCPNDEHANDFHRR